jgi:hemerythrin superfamily protein
MPTRSTSRTASNAKTRRPQAERNPSASRAGPTGASRAAPRKKAPSGAPKVVPRNASLAVELLMTDHREVEALFKAYAREESEQGRRSVATRICAALALHAQVEEQLFYPFVREQIAATDLVDEAEVEHGSLKDLIAQIQDSQNVDEKFDARIHVLKEYVQHHVKEEENEIFPKLKNMKPDLDELGQEMHQLKQSLEAEMAEPGEPDPEAIRRQTSGVPVLERPREQR